MGAGGTNDEDMDARVCMCVCAAVFVCQAYGALGDVAGAVSKALAPETLEQLPRMSATQHMQQQCSCRTQRSSSGSSTAPEAAASHQAPPSCACAASSVLCVVCQCEFEGSEVLKLLPSCGHVYHAECIDQWLASSKVWLRN